LFVTVIKITAKRLIIICKIVFAILWRGFVLLSYHKYKCGVTVEKHGMFLQKLKNNIFQLKKGKYGLVS